MESKFLVSCLSLSLVFSTFSQISCQVDPSRTLDIDRINSEYQAILNSLQDHEAEYLYAKIESDLLTSSNSTSTEESDISLSFSDDISAEVEAVTDEQNYRELHASNSKKMAETFEEDYKDSIKKLTKHRKINESFPSSDGFCGCFNKEGGVINETNGCSVEFQEIISENSSTNAGSEIYETTSTLIKLIENHRKSNFFGYEFRFNATQESRKSMENLKLTLKNLVTRLSIHQLLIHPKFDLIAELIIHLDLFSSLEYTSTFISLIKYRDTILEGFEASKRIEGSELRANILKKIAIEKELKYDAKYKETMHFAELADQLKVRILTLKKLLVKLESDRLKAIGKYRSVESSLKMLLNESVRAKEEYIVAARKANQEIAATEFALKEVKSAEYMWHQLKRSLIN